MDDPRPWVVAAAPWGHRLLVAPAIVAETTATVPAAIAATVTATAASTMTAITVALL
jgi:hypothetical protein